MKGRQGKRERQKDIDLGGIEGEVEAKRSTRTPTCFAIHAICVYAACSMSNTASLRCHKHSFFVSSLSLSLARFLCLSLSFSTKSMPMPMPMPIVTQSKMSKNNNNQSQDQQHGGSARICIAAVHHIQAGLDTKKHFKGGLGKIKGQERRPRAGRRGFECKRRPKKA